MTKDSLKVLELLKKAQVTEDNTVYLNTDELFARTVIESGQPYVSVDLSEYSGCLWSILVYLAEQRLIMNLSGDFEYIQVTHEGWCHSQSLRAHNGLIWKERLIGAGITLAVWGLQELIVWLLHK